MIDFVGSEPSSALALASLRKGGKLIVVGMYGGELRFPLPFLPMQARTIEGNYVGSLQDMDELMALVREDAFLRSPSTAANRSKQGRSSPG